MILVVRETQLSGFTCCHPSLTMDQLFASRQVAWLLWGSESIAHGM